MCHLDMKRDNPLVQPISPQGMMGRMLLEAQTMNEENIQSVSNMKGVPMSPSPC